MPRELIATDVRTPVLKEYDDSPLPAGHAAIDLVLALLAWDPDARLPAAAAALPPPLLALRRRLPGHRRARGGAAAAGVPRRPCVGRPRAQNLMGDAKNEKYETF